MQQDVDVADPSASTVSEEAFLTEQIITYIGNKRALLDLIGEGVREVKQRLGQDRLRVLDVFSGSGVVARYLKPHSHFLHANDLERYVEVINTCYLSNHEELDLAAIEQAITYVNREAAARLAPGFISELYAPDDDAHIREGERVFYTTRNARFIDTARRLIDALDAALQPYVLAPLLYEASVHTNTSGVFKGFYKNSRTNTGQFGGNGRNALPRITQDIRIPAPVFSNHACACRITRGDANEVARQYGGFDLAYVDPPYNQHPYGSNYFMLNLIADYERPAAISKVAGIPKDWNRSRYNSRRAITSAFTELVEALDARYLLISFNSEGFIPREAMLELLTDHGTVETLSTRYNTFRGSRNLAERDLYVTEYLYLLEKR